MATDWHEQFKLWAKAPTEREEEKGSNAAQVINDALRSFPALKSRNFEVYPTGSYRNNTNVRLDSDIDVAVVLKDAVFFEYPPDGSVTAEILGVKPVSYGLDDFRSDVEDALVLKFESNAVSPSDKTINVSESKRRLDSDVTAFLEHRRYSGQKSPDQTWYYDRGVETRSRKDPSKRIVNWHQQHYDAGVKRNAETNRRFKRITRILKRLRNDMLESGVAEAKPIPSFLIECLVFNCPDVCFNVEEGSYYEDVKSTIVFLWTVTEDDQSCEPLVEVSGMKQLFASTQPWTRKSVNDFLLQVWIHVGFE